MSFEFKYTPETPTHEEKSESAPPPPVENPRLRLRKNFENELKSEAEKIGILTRRLKEYQDVETGKREEMFNMIYTDTRGGEDDANIIKKMRNSLIQEQALAKEKIEVIKQRDKTDIERIEEQEFSIRRAKARILSLDDYMRRRSVEQLQQLGKLRRTG